MVESSADMLTIPVRIQILSSADNTTLLHNELDCILLDASSRCEYNAFVDNEGMTQIRIECISTKEESRYALEKLGSKNVSHEMTTTSSVARPL
jgi:hypothetical protein